MAFDFHVKVLVLELRMAGVFDEVDMHRSLVAWALDLWTISTGPCM